MYQDRKSDQCIIIFTKDRLLTLSRLIKHLVNIGKDVIILDDSISKKIQNTISLLCGKADNIFYHGKEEQKIIFQNLGGLGINQFTEPLGTKGWHLGFVRNYAIILSRLLRYKRVLFIDDDIIIKDMNVINNLMKKVNDADFVGAKILGKPDYSIVDEIADKCNLKLEMSDISSGGFLAFNSDTISEYFLNYYNEDIIWIYLHSPKIKIVNCGAVHQQSYELPENKSEQASNQEFGEILFQGVYKAFKRNNSMLLTQKSFWSNVLDREMRYIRKLKELYKEKNIKDETINIFKPLLCYLSRISPDNFLKVFTKYFKTRDIWRDILAELDANGCYTNIINLILTKKARRYRYE